MTRRISRRALERAQMLSRLTAEEREQRTARGNLKASLWLMPAGIVIVGIYVSSWWQAQATQSTTFIRLSRFRDGDPFPWLVVVAPLLYFAWRLVRDWRRRRKVCRPRATTPEP